MPEIPLQPLLENTATLENPVTEVETGPTAKDATPARTPLSGITGIVALGLVFVASASFAYSYVRDTLLESVPATEQVASVGTVHADAFAFVQLQAQSAYVYDLRTHRVLFALNPDAPRPLASLTKVATVLAVSEVLAPHSTITIPYDTAPLGRPERLTQGAVWKLQDVIDFTLVSSSNEGADILAQAANDAIHKQYPESPEAGATVWRMNNLVHNLGLTDMYFTNDSGLDVSGTQAGAYGSAREVSTLFAYAASTSHSTFAGTARDGILLTAESGEKASAFNTNTVLGAIPGLIMGKTGYTTLAGGNLAIVFDIGLGHPIVAVVLGSTEHDRFEDMKKLVAATAIAAAQ